MTSNYDIDKKLAKDLPCCKGLETTIEYVEVTEPVWSEWNPKERRASILNVAIVQFVYQKPYRWTLQYINKSVWKALE